MTTIAGFPRDALRSLCDDRMASSRLVLMGNHDHLFIETPEANLGAGMSWLQNMVTRRYHVRQMAWGRLFGDRYKAVLVDGADSYHYRTLADSIQSLPKNWGDFGKGHGRADEIIAGLPEDTAGEGAWRRPSGTLVEGGTRSRRNAA